jgi:LPXTG-site transpeptidase (sortase) family protein
MEVSNWTQLTDAILLRKKAFLVAFFVIFFSSYAVLSALDWLPELVFAKDVTTIVEEVEVVAEANSIEITAPAIIETPIVALPISPVYPLTLSIPVLDKTVQVLNPTSRNVVDLDTALLSGVVRHPDSATLEQMGTVFIMGHSSYLPAVKNKSFQAFNGIQNLKWGDEIEITTLDITYVYRVEKVYRARAKDETVAIAGLKQRLVLATCNSFGTADDRYIVEAELVRTE